MAKAMSEFTTDLQHSGMPAKDLDETIEFYTKKLGFELAGLFQDVYKRQLDVPAASITLEDGETYAGKIEHEGGSGAAVEVDGGFVCTSYLVLPEDLPEG